MEYHIFSGTSPSSRRVFLKKMTKSFRRSVGMQQAAFSLAQNAKMTTQDPIQGQLSLCLPL